MRFSPEFLEEIRARLPVSAVTGRKVRLKKQGREWRGLSPFTPEKTPSFFVNDQKGRWFDFSAGKNGNIFDFVMETEGLSFPEAVERLAGEAGLSLPALSREDVARDARRATTIDALEEAALFFQSRLRSREGDSARAYLVGRGMDDDIQHTFRLGVAPREKYALRDHLASKGVSRDTMIEAGLLIHGPDIEVPFDRFRDRVMFPISDRGGRVIAFGGRALDPSAPAKYLNSPETPLFHKGAGLYNHHRARKAAHETDRVIVVEGYVDVLAMTAAGFAETVAPLGTALTQEQCALLWGMAAEPILCFDGDRAGRKAARRAIETALPLIGDGRTLRFANLPDGQDPDDLLRTGGADAVVSVVETARPLVDELWAQERDARPLETPEQRTDLLNRLMQLSEPIADWNLRRAYQQELRDRHFALFRQNRPRQGARQAARPGSPGRTSILGAPGVSDRLARSTVFAAGGGLSHREALILRTMLEYPALIADHAEDLAGLSFADRDVERLRVFVLQLLDYDLLDRDSVGRGIAERGLQSAAERVRYVAGPARTPSAPSDDPPLDVCVALRQALDLQRQGPALLKLGVAAEAFAADPSERNWEILRDVRAHASRRDGLEAGLADAAEEGS